MRCEVVSAMQGLLDGFSALGKMEYGRRLSDADVDGRRKALWDLIKVAKCRFTNIQSDS